MDSIDAMRGNPSPTAESLRWNDLVVGLSMTNLCSLRYVCHVTCRRVAQTSLFWNSITGIGQNPRYQDSL